MLRQDIPLCLSRKGQVFLGATHFLGQRCFSKGKQQKEVRQRDVACCLVLEAYGLARTEQGPRDHNA